MWCALLGGLCGFCSFGTVGLLVSGLLCLGLILWLVLFWLVLGLVHVVNLWVWVFSFLIWVVCWLDGCGLLVLPLG